MSHMLYLLQILPSPSFPTVCVPVTLCSHGSQHQLELLKEDKGIFSHSTETLLLSKLYKSPPSLISVGEAVGAAGRSEGGHLLKGAQMNPWQKDDRKEMEDVSGSLTFQ